ncbi:MAG: efflux RND transporter permease subunit [Bacteroidales bacterium]
MITRNRWIQLFPSLKGFQNCPYTFRSDYACFACSIYFPAKLEGRNNSVNYRTGFSLIGALAVFPLLGFSINTLSLLGLVLAIGIVVDDAIVVVEAVMHHIEHGKTPKEATLQAMKEVSGPVVAIALILCAVFIPVALTPGITGRFYQQFAITIAVSVAFSAFSALSLSPALSAMLLKPTKPLDQQKDFCLSFTDGSIKYSMV